ncbi:hypothetical protein [Streptomyces sp. NPDC058745]|uniref:hypothetical protein n=1 Tax=Streptomyces sp. NPDC058745 TaxID=3346621 RepID=UPI0036C1D283
MDLRGGALQILEVARYGDGGPPTTGRWPAGEARPAPETAGCVVRCVGGEPRVGDRFDGDTLVLEDIDFHGRPVDSVTPPCAAKVRLSGPGVRTLRPWIVISSAEPRRYGYVGPPEIRAAAPERRTGSPISRPADLAAWLAGQSRADLAEPFTYVVDEDGVLLLAPRRSEHVACAGRRALVRAAGEVAFAEGPEGPRAVEISNQSTGYCPDPDSWDSVALALDRAGLAHDGGFDHVVVFRRCPRCAQLNLVREDDYVCPPCGAELPRHWNPPADEADESRAFSGRRRPPS